MSQSHPCSTVRVRRIEGQSAKTCQNNKVCGASLFPHRVILNRGLLWDQPLKRPAGYQSQVLSDGQCVSQGILRLGDRIAIHEKMVNPEMTWIWQVRSAGRQVAGGPTWV